MACGPWFPNSLLDNGDEAVLAAPYASFFREIERMQLVSSAHAARPLTNTQSYAEQAAEADLKDLRNALWKKGVPLETRVALVKSYQAERSKLIEKKPEGAEHKPVIPPDENQEPASVAELPAGIPVEFADYFRGAIAWASGDTNAAVAAWKALLARPREERSCKSTWAAFMIGKTLISSDPEKARDHFQRVRSLTLDGASDSLGLAAASLGWEAKTYYAQDDLLPATELYLEQAAAGDHSAIVSLHWVAAKVIKQGGARMEQFARHPKAQRVITAYLLDGHNAGNEPEGFLPDSNRMAQWLTAVEASGTASVVAGEQLALVAYRCGNTERAKRWLKFAGNTPVTQWLQAKILLREGKIDQAATLLARVSHSFPLAPVDAIERKNGTFKDSLFMDFLDTDPGSWRTGSDQLWGELGAIRLARREYCESLEALLRAGFWNDAAYVAERVLTLDELKKFVDQRWSVDPELRKPELDEDLSDAQRAFRVRLSSTRQSLRSLLARRLTRMNRGLEARVYFPEELLPHYNSLMTALDAGNDEGKPAEERSQQLMAAARIARHQGMELMATELGPDYAIHGGAYEVGLSPTNRLRFHKGVDASGVEKEVPVTLRPSNDELRRANDEPADPCVRFHYRYVAADLGWAAAHLLPDNTDAKARILCEVGTWIKYLDPVSADRFYKELVRKCRKTTVGQLADAIRWFPSLDEDGNLSPKQPSPRNRESRAEPVPDERDDPSGSGVSQ
ncbi:MAG: LysM domain protein [Verrucomicrobiales bacterium]|nr:LysM domain protein [Verrucomicrobiales bacterium]